MEYFESSDNAPPFKLEGTYGNYGNILFVYCLSTFTGKVGKELVEEYKKTFA